MNTNDFAYMIVCLLLDASGIAFGMGLFRVSTFTKRLARATNERWKLDGEPDDFTEEARPTSEEERHG